MLLEIATSGVLKNNVTETPVIAMDIEDMDSNGDDSLDIPMDLPTRSLHSHSDAHGSRGIAASHNDVLDNQVMPLSEKLADDSSQKGDRMQSGDVAVDGNGNERKQAQLHEKPFTEKIEENASLAHELGLEDFEDDESEDSGGDIGQEADGQPISPMSNSPM